MTRSILFNVNSQPWNKGVIIGPKPPLKLKEIWVIRIRLQLSGDVHNLAVNDRYSTESGHRICLVFNIPKDG